MNHSLHPGFRDTARLSTLVPLPGPVGDCGEGSCHGMDVLVAHATMVNRIAEMLLRSKDSRAILDALVLITGEGFAVDRSLIYRVDFAGERIYALAEYLSPGNVPTTDSYPLATFAASTRYFLETHCWLESHAAAAHPLLVEEGSARMLHGERKIQSLLWYPFAFDDSGFFLLVFNQVTAPRAWGELIELVAAVARLVGIALMKLDLLARSRAADEALAQAQKLDSLGVLAAGMAHDFNNLLTVVLGNAELARAQLPAQSPAKAHLDALSSASWLASGLVRDLLGYAGRTRPMVGETEVASLVSGILRILQHSINKNVVVESILATELPLMQADENQIRQVLMNLLLNAADAIGLRPGKIVVRAELVSGRLERSIQCVVFSVSDDGCGMTEEVRRRIFDPFFTTKPQGRGLGLAAVRGIVAAHNGTIEVESEVGRGTTFRVFLPCAAPERSAGVRLGTCPVAQTAAQTLLVADDDEAVRSVVGRILGTQGHTVIEAHDVSSALEVLRERRGEIQVVLVDRTLKGGGAKPILDAVGGPGAFPVIILSAVGDSSGEDLDCVEVLEKPFTIAKAQEALVRVSLV